jgi:hypothetical protein
VRKNVGENYHGCLRIDVRRSAELYHRIEGWAKGYHGPQLGSKWPSIEPGLAAPGEGFEPSLTDPKSVVLPARRPGIVRVLTLPGTAQRLAGVGRGWAADTRCGSFFAHAGAPGG